MSKSHLAGATVISLNAAKQERAYQSDSARHRLAAQIRELGASQMIGEELIVACEQACAEFRASTNRPAEFHARVVPAHQNVDLAIEGLRALLQKSAQDSEKSPDSFAAFEDSVHQQVMEIERKAVQAKLEQFDPDAHGILINGVPHRRVLTSEQEYDCAAGKVVVARGLYRPCAEPDALSVCPMELRAGIVCGTWSPRAAKQAVWAVSQLTPMKAEELFRRVGNMTPSKSGIGRLAARLSDRWEEEREELEAALLLAIEVPKETVSIAVSLDGVHIPMDRAEGNDASVSATSAMVKSNSGSNYREAGCATVSFCGANGEFLGAIRMARVPEHKKETLKHMLTGTVSEILRRRPDLTVVKIADGARDNWTYLDSTALPRGPEVLDFFHASGHLHDAVESVFGADTHETKEWYSQLRTTLRYHKYGAGKVISALEGFQKDRPRNVTLQRELAYFRANKRRMKYATIAEQGMMIGSGVVEAACKTLVTQRLKQSGMRWSSRGAQSILTPRGWDQSDLFDKAWALVAATYGGDITVVANVIDIGSTHDGKRR
ncbi:MAG: hypothetical protein FWD57_12230 [Polyangiaceae bacterium]|nr:hypothetical protein [Polyangiaceae bacterium]